MMTRIRQRTIVLGESADKLTTVSTEPTCPFFLPLTCPENGQTSNSLDNIHTAIVINLLDFASFVRFSYKTLKLKMQYR